MSIQLMALGINTPHMSPSQNLQKSNTKNDDAFSSVLSKTQDKQGNQENNKVKNDKNSSQTKSNSIEEATGETTNTVEKDISTPTKEVSKPEKDILEESMLGEEAVIEEIANLLQITPDELEQLLATLQISVFDLLQMDNLQQLIMQVHGVEEPMDLLLIPEVASEIKMITSILEEHATNNLVSIPGELEEQLEIKIDENILNVNANSEKKIQTNIKTDNESKVLDENNEALDTGQSSTSKVSESIGNNEKLSQNQEQSTPNQNTSTNQFLDTLTQSMGEAFQLQSEQVGDVNEAILSRHEVVEPRVILDQIVERIKVSVIEEEAQMSIQLRPEHLGKLSMEVISKQGVMTAHFTVESERVKAMIEQNIQDLKDVLEGKGLVIEQLEVTVGQNQQDNEQSHKNSKSSKNISNMINSIMNEDILEEELNLEKRHVNETSEVDFTA